MTTPAPEQQHDAALKNHEQSAPQKVFGPGSGSYSEFMRITDFLREETWGGMILVVAALIGVILANTPLQDIYFGMRDTHLAIPLLGLDLSVGHWAADGLLAVFFFMVGLELKHEFVAGDLRNIKTAIVPVIAAAGGVVVPALIYAALNFTNPDALRGWAIPTATDIAFAVAVLGIIGSHLPGSLRIFLLTLAVVDDLIAIVIIAVFYSTDLSFAYLAAAIIPIALYAFLANKFKAFFAEKPWAGWVILLPIGVVTWVLMHHSGIHATIAGVILGLSVPAVAHKKGAESLCLDFEHRFRPLSSGVAVPIFAFFSAGVYLGGAEGLMAIAGTTAALGVLAGLILGKPIGILLAVFLTTKFTKADLDESVRWIDLLGVSILAGIGFTVSLLVSELSFPTHPELQDATKAAVMIASVCAALLAAVILTLRNNHYKQVEAEALADDDHDGVPNFYDKEPYNPAVS